MAKKKKARRNTAGESSVARIINEQNGETGQIQKLPEDRSDFHIVSDHARKRFAWIISICTGLMGIMLVYTNFIRADQIQTDDITHLKAEQLTIKADVGEIKTNIGENHDKTQKQIADTHKETNKGVNENKNGRLNADFKKGHLN